MRKLLIFLLTTTFAGCWLTSCEEDEWVSVPVAPILKEVVFPSVNAVMPGQIARIQGKGFASEDVVIMQGNGENYTISVSVATNEYMEFIVPKEAAGDYSITIERSGKQTLLEGVFRVPFVLVLEDVALPTAQLSRGSVATIAGKGFENGDLVKLTASFYPDGKVYKIAGTQTAEGLSFTVPQAVYGINSVTVARGNRQNSLGTVVVATNVGDELGGGLVYWVSDNKQHGLIASKVNAGSPVEQWGPEVALDLVVGTNQAMGSGASNTEKIVAKMADYRSRWSEWNSVIVAAEYCVGHSVTEDDLTYTDWFLPSLEELTELFKVKGADKSFISANNYWTSSEHPDGPGWSAFYVNFYESTNLVTGPASKSGWLIGVRPVRSY